jgi:hypothetical protein
MDLKSKMHAMLLICNAFLTARLRGYWVHMSHRRNSKLCGATVASFRQGLALQAESRGLHLSNYRLIHAMKQCHPAYDRHRQVALLQRLPTDRGQCGCAVTRCPRQEVGLRDQRGRGGRGILRRLLQFLPRLCPHPAVKILIFPTVITHEARNLYHTANQY